MSRTSELGLTLVETLIAAALLALVVTPASMFLIRTQQTEQFVGEATRQQQDARVALERFARNLREADYPEGHNEATSLLIKSASAYSVEFWSDVNNDDLVDELQYSLDAASGVMSRTLKSPTCTDLNDRTTCAYPASGGASEIVRGVRNGSASSCGSATPIFRYFQRDRGSGGLAEQDPSSLGGLLRINYIEMRLILDIRADRTPTCQDIKTTVSLRNWKG